MALSFIPPSALEKALSTVENTVTSKETTSGAGCHAAITACWAYESPHGKKSRIVGIMNPRTKAGKINFALGTSLPDRMRNVAPPEMKKKNAK